VADGYDPSDGKFHLNFGWSSTSSDAWYDLPQIGSVGGYNFNVIKHVVRDITPYQGWNQYGADARNSFSTIYAGPTETPIRRKWRFEIENVCQGMVVGTGNKIYISQDPLIIDDTYHPGVYVIDYQGHQLKYIEISSENSYVTHPAQGPTGQVYVGTGSGRVYRIDPRTDAVSHIFTEPSGGEMGTPKVDEDGYIYVSTVDILYRLFPSGVKDWEFDVPGSAKMRRGTPAIDLGRGKAYVGYYDSAAEITYLGCVSIQNGDLLYEKSFSGIPFSSRMTGIASVASDGTVYVGVDSRLYAFTPGSSSFTEKWSRDLGTDIAKPPAIGRDGTLYISHWTNISGSYYVTLAALDAANGNTKWQVLKPDIGTYTDMGDTYVTGNDTVVFSVFWDTSPDRTYELFAYRDLGASYEALWNYPFQDDAFGSIAFGPSNSIYVYMQSGKTVSALSEGEVGDPHGAGMDYLNNRAPSIPSILSPTAGAKGLDTTVTLSWTGTDPDAHALTYSVYLAEAEPDQEGTSLDGPLGCFFAIADDLQENSYPLAGLKPGTSYLWHVVASDGQSFTDGPTWSFTTAGLPGDANGDGSVTPGDAQAAFDYFLGIETPPHPENCDVCPTFPDGDGSVTPGDAQAIFNVFLGLPTPCD
jgi:putative pyrroloquinoline-quinone binding quinoprotein/fibronectin type III domain protein